MLDVKKMAAAFEDELKKIAIAMPKGKTVPLLAAGALGWETIRRANQDRKLGRQVRMQQGSGF